MKFIYLVLGLLLLSSCVTEVYEDDDMGKDRHGGSGGWSATGTMVNNGTNSAAHLQVNFLERDKNPTPSKNYTVQFAVGPTKLSNGMNFKIPVNPIAEIKWSVEGNDVRRLVSVTNGLSLTGVGEAIKVSVTDQSFIFNNGVSDITGVTYDVGITVAPGSRASVVQPPTYSVINPADGSYIYSVAPAASTFLQIPQDAGVISTYVTVFDATHIPIPEGGAEVSIKNPFLVSRVYDPRLGWVPVVAGADQIVLTNNTATSQKYSVTFGIDG